MKETGKVFSKNKPIHAMVQKLHYTTCGPKYDSETLKSFQGYQQVVDSLLQKLDITTLKNVIIFKKDVQNEGGGILVIIFKEVEHPAS